ncbi:MFS transporter [Roseateles sp. PN1]|uniref:MFS transporter n=1 Tax=Roseateles sp. PN1 TaxID=3137372 RepID=UPI0040545C2E
MPSTFHDKKVPAVNPPSQHTSQFGLLKQRRFAPFFWTQFLGAANDNISKFALTVMVTYQLQLQWLPAAQAGVVIAALFILPFVLFSATSGQLADKFEKGGLMRLVKNFEIAIMALALWGFWHAQVPLLLACVFMMGMHSTLFGPVKFAYLPQQLSERELTGGNGMVEMGTFVAIILGNVLGGLLIGLPEVGAIATGLACLAVAVAGRIAAQFVPHSPATDPQLRINWNPFTETWNNLKLAYQDKVVFRSLVGISWMWFFGVVFLANFPSFAKEVLHGQSAVASLLMVVFSVGVGIGALLCELLSRRHVEIGLAPLGALGMTVFAVDLYFASRGLPAAPLLGVAEFLSQPAHWRVLLDLGMLALSAGLYSVPMYALIQLRSQPSHRARIIAANNILNALFMIASSLGAGVLIGAGFSIPEVFLTVGLLNLAVAVYICVLVPEYLLRAIAFVCSRLRYRLGHSGTGAIPATGAALLLLENKPVSASHALLLTAASPRSINFFMARPLVARPVAGWLWRANMACPLAPPELALRHARQRLTAGELVCLGQADAGATELLEKLRKARPDVPVLTLQLSDTGGLLSRVDLHVSGPSPAEAAA